jgi:hypothetical protein
MLLCSSPLQQTHSDIFVPGMFPALLLVAAILPKTANTLTSRRFQNWYWYDNTFGNILRENCSSQYANYVNHHDNGWYINFPYRRDPNQTSPWVYIDPVVICLLDNTNDLNKANMAGASVLLGLAPTILATAGSTLAETSLLSIRRPLLAFLLALGSPSVPPLRTFHHEDIPGMLVRRKSGLTIELSSTGRIAVLNALIVLIEIILALAAIINVLLTSYELGMRTILSFGADVWFDPLMWSLFTLFPHVFGCLVLRNDVKILSPQPNYRKKLAERVRHWARDEFSPCSSHEVPTTLKYRADTLLFLTLSWLSAVITLLHYCMGTL